MKKTLPLAFLCLFLNSSITHAQGELPVNMYTGTPNVEIPIYTLTDHDLSHPVTLSYNASGVRVDESSAPVGLGWSIVAGGSIGREVRGLPDDFAGTGTDVRRGWRYANSAANAVHGMSNTSDIPNTCGDELQDYSTMYSFNGSADTEPDIFSYNIPGYSGKFVFDKDGAVRMIPFRDLKITPSAPNGTDRKITSFTITTNDGVVYTFEQIISATRWAMKPSLAPSVEFLKSDFLLYDLDTHGAKVVYNAEWKLSKIKSPSGAEIIISYAINHTIDSRDSVKVAIRNSTTADFQIKTAYVNVLQSNKMDAYVIQGLSGGMKMTFEYGSQTKMLDRISVRQGNREFKYVDLAYKGVRTIGADYFRQFLYSVAESGECEHLPPYTFSYADISFVGALTTTLPMPGTKKKDFWGYYNGKPNSSLVPRIYVYPALAPAERYRLHPIPGYTGTVVMLDGADRVPDKHFTTMGSLESIIYPWGGSTTIEYEPNEYYDETAQQNFPGGGLRIRSATYFDGLNTAANIVKHFTYTTDGQRSSGRLISRPAFAMPVKEYRDPLNSANIKTYATLAAGPVQDLWEHLTVRTTEDLSPGETTQGSVVGYKKVTVARPGSGSAVFEFHMPGVFGESANGQWVATQNKFARSTACPDMGIVTQGGAFAYPYSPQPLFDHERGLLHRKLEYNEAGIKVRETTNTYQHLYKTAAPATKVWGLRYDNYANGASTYFFGKYFLLTDVDRVLSTETVTVFDEADVNRFTTNVSEYLYESNYHRLLTRVRTTNSDGVIHTSTTKYPLDYGTIPFGADKASSMIGVLQSSFRNGIPIEQASFIEKPGEGQKVVSAALTKYDDFGTSQVLPAVSLVLNVERPLPFISSYIDASGTFVHDAAYQQVQTNLVFDAYGLPLSVKGATPVITGTHWGHNKTLPAAVAKDARHDEFVFSDFESSTGFDFGLATGFRYGAGRTGDYGLYPNVLMSKVVQKADVQNYVLSFWFKKLSAPLDFRVAVKNIAGTVTYYENVFSASAATTGYELIKKIVPVHAVPTGSFLVEFQGQLTGSVPPSLSLLPMIDDVAFYPERAELTTFVYDRPFGVSAVTDARGRTSYTQYDKLGRVRYLLDHDKNIRQRNTYTFTSLPIRLSAVIEEPINLYAGQLTFRVNGNECIDGEMYEWSTGGSWFSTGTTASMSQVFNQPGTHTIRVRVSHPDHATVEGSIHFTVTYEPMEVTMCARGTYRFNTCTGEIVNYECQNVAAPSHPLYTTFKVYPQAEEGPGGTMPTFTYQWYKRDMDVTSWSPVSTNQEYTWHLVSPYESYVVKCVVIDSFGRTGETDEYAVFVHCNENN